MKRLSDFKDDKAFEIVAELLDPITAIATDKDNLMKGKKTRVEVAKAVFINHKDDVKKIIAILSEKDVDELEINAATLFSDFLTLLSDPDFMGFFKSAA